jgi:hypothetical protein
VGSVVQLLQFLLRQTDTIIGNHKPDRGIRTVQNDFDFALLRILLDRPFTLIDNKSPPEVTAFKKIRRK